MAAGKVYAVGQGQSLGKESHMCELLEAEDIRDRERCRRMGLRDLDEALTVATEQYF